MTWFSNKPDFPKFVAEIKKHCPSALALYKKDRPFIRGMTRTEESYFAWAPPENRTPLNSTKEQHEIMNNIFKKAGLHARRNNSFFAETHSGGFNRLENIYGDTFYTFPVEGSWITYPRNEDFKDMYDEIYRDNHAKIYAFNKEEIIPNETAEDQIQRIFNKADYQQIQLTSPTIPWTVHRYPFGQLELMIRGKCYFIACHMKSELEETLNALE